MTNRAEVEEIVLEIARKVNEDYYKNLIWFEDEVLLATKYAHFHGIRTIGTFSSPQQLFCAAIRQSGRSKTYAMHLWAQPQYPVRGQSSGNADPHGLFYLEECCRRGFIDITCADWLAPSKETGTEAATMLDKLRRICLRIKAAERDGTGRRVVNTCIHSANDPYKRFFEFMARCAGFNERWTECAWNYWELPEEAAENTHP
jgi:hypothetical protein